ncbi:hypothetical protein EFJ98_03885 [Pseudomonas putida]|nr:hypothetical protein EFJ98_03885 [Pseudomonas putida]
MIRLLMKRRWTFVGAGLPAKQTTRWMARAMPVFAGKPAPTVIAQISRFEQGSNPTTRSVLVVRGEQACHDAGQS